MRTLKGEGGVAGAFAGEGAVRSTGASVARNRKTGRGCRTLGTADCCPTPISPDEQMSRRCGRAAWKADAAIVVARRPAMVGCDPGRAAAEWDKTAARSWAQATERSSGRKTKRRKEYA
jgi:hypothetical protein